MAPAGRELILGVSGSIAANKAVYLLREPVRQGDSVTVVTSAHA
jgi:phosphopantothenoylcysteine synthetase/decarboxylase